MKELCRQTLERAYLFLDGEILSEVDRVEIELHLEECRPCYERVGLQRELSALVRRLSTYSQCPDELKSRIRALIYSV